MVASDTTEITKLLARCRAGDAEAAAELMPIVYEHLRELAHHYLQSERANHTLQPTALVHEAYLRLFRPPAPTDDKEDDEEAAVEIENRAHFFVIAARQMRRILVDHARHKQAGKREGARQQVELSEAAGHTPAPDPDVLALEQVLCRLEAQHPRAAQIVELRYFGGMTEKEAAAALNISVSTLKREWEFARAWLFKRLKSN